MLRQANRDSGATVGDAMRSPLLVPESAHLEDVLIEMRKKQTHFAIVLDEFGSTAGIITMEDILEELVGEIRDEYDLKEYGIKDIDNGFRVPGTLRPDELEDGTGCQLPDGEYETVAGYVLEQLGRMARRGDEVTANGGWSLRVANVRRRRILSVDVLKPSTTPGL
jgi:putative hemolysin